MQVLQVYTLKSGTVNILADFGPKIDFCKSAQNTTKLILLHSIEHSYMVSKWINFKKLFT